MSPRSVGFVTRWREIFFGLWGWTVFAFLVSIGLLVALLVPGPARRARWLAGISRGVFVLSGADVTIEGLENLPEGRSVVVGNHASYLDGILLNGYLPSRFAFVIKGEMRDIPIVHFLLRRGGSKFVERFEAVGSSRDARHLVKAAKGGESLGFFPEGTFREHPGVGHFRPGAFAAAIKAEVPVVPIVIWGTREMHPGEPKLPKPVPLRVKILPAIMPDDPAFVGKRELAETARQQIIAELGEPDLCDA